jgi:hypothetical protein
VHTGDGLPVELDQARLAGGIDEPEGMHAEPLHGPKRAGNTAVAHIPEHVMRRFGVQRYEIPERVMGRLRLPDFPVGLRPGRMDDVRKLDAVMNEEHGVLLPTKSNVPSLVQNFTANPRVSRTVSADPREPSTVEKRVKTSVFVPFLPRNRALVTDAVLP